MGETNNTNQDQLPVTGLASNGSNGSTSNTKTYTEGEYNQAIEKAKSDAMAQAGRERKSVEDENRTLKSQLATNQSLISDTQEKIKKLNDQIEELSANDPDKAKLVKRLKDLEATEDKLRADRQTLDAEKLTHAEAIKKAQEFSFKENVSKVASEFKNSDAVRLKTACEKLKITDEASIRTIADTFWEKITAEPEKKPDTPVTPVDGVTNGNNKDTSKMSPMEKIKYGQEHPKK